MNATENEVRTALTTLQNAVSGLRENGSSVPVVNKTELRNLYNSNKDKRQGNYTQESWNVFTSALNNANTIIEKTDATEDEVRIALTSLHSAISGLRENESSVQVVNKTELRNLYNSNKDKRQGNYTQASWNVFTSALNNANTIIEKTDATENEVRTALTNLQNAVSGLQENTSTHTADKCNIKGTESVGKILRVQVKDSDGEVINKNLTYQ
ncbi:hypothetical protein [uncultured Clostridium sp.]|uniref:hypothetical protein n=1 Tax=uncultured Clostridium sp. TaxID=59620 RepID=UPI0025E1F2DE|nr:hypothetical protein [uncultured Clostridium sp.]